MLKFKCSQCECGYVELRYRYSYYDRYYYAVCRDFGHGNRVEVPVYIPDEQVERYLNAKV